MASELTLPMPDLWLLASGKSVVAFASRHAVDLNDELELAPGPPRPVAELKAEPGAVVEPSALDDLTALVMGVQPASSLSPESDNNFLTILPEGDVLILRVYRENRPVLDDAEFEALRAEVEAEFH
ncbi:MAG: hypothetical protein V3U39_12630 [Acidimicrobiia bacterium]